MPPRLGPGSWALAPVHPGPGPRVGYFFKVSPFHKGCKSLRETIAFGNLSSHFLTRSASTFNGHQAVWAQFACCNLVSCNPLNALSFAALHSFIALCLTASCCICCYRPHGPPFYLPGARDPGTPCGTPWDTVGHQLDTVGHQLDARELKNEDKS